MTTLKHLKPDQQARIVQISGDDAVSMRLMEMGLIEGELIEFIGAAPLGDPLEFAIRGYRLSLRKKEADKVEVEIIE
jgi:ferrous iron transport protein A